MEYGWEVAAWRRVCESGRHTVAGWSIKLALEGELVVRDLEGGSTMRFDERRAGEVARRGARQASWG